jgi:hypothetical protein
MSIILQGSTSGSVTLQEPAIAGTTVLDLPATSGTVITSNGSGDIQFNSGYGSVATAYGCRAWVNFNGTGTVAIRGSGNVSSITDVSTGRYNVNFTTAMPDTNYSPVAFLNGEGGTNEGSFVAAGLWGLNNLTTGSFRAEYYNGGYVDSALVFVAVFR